MSELKTWVNWLDAAGKLRSAAQDYVLVTVLGVRGSTPRDALCSLSGYRRSPDFHAPATPEAVLRACREMQQ